jgi:putative phosphoesterase
MKIAVLSDTHSRHATVHRALEIVRGRGVETVLHCGDIEDPETVELFRGFSAHFVFGNCDGDRDGLRTAMKAAGVTPHENFGHVELAGQKLAFLHGDDRKLMHDVEHSGAYDFLLYGHSHVAEEHRTGPTRVINPGALHRARPKRFIVLDLATGAVEAVEVE